MAPVGPIGAWSPSPPSSSPTPAEGAVERARAGLLRGVRQSAFLAALGALLVLGGFLFVRATALPVGEDPKKNAFSWFFWVVLLVAEVALLYVFSYRRRCLTLIRRRHPMPLLMDCYPHVFNTGYRSIPYRRRVVVLKEPMNPLGKPVVVLVAMLDREASDPRRAGVPVLLYGDPRRSTILAVVDLTEARAFGGNRQGWFRTKQFTIDDY